jgi:acetylornithine deacetylase/succinyl-diaminopimelate desuccinylase-like protein
MTKESILSDVRAVIDKLKTKDRNFVAEVRLAPEGPAPGVMNFIPGIVEVEENALHLSAPDAGVREKSLNCFGKNAYTDAVAFSLHGIPALTFGPAEEDWPPINEFIDLHQAMIVTKAYALAVARILGIQE